MPWLVLIYTLPAEPTRKRAFVWRELKKIGAVYLRDGVCVLPDQPATRLGLQAIVDRVRGYDGQASLVEAAVLDELTAAEVVRQAQAARRSEYVAIAESVGELLAHVRRERRHRDVGVSEGQALVADVSKLRRWFEQIRGRDYFGSDAAGAAEAVLLDCESVFRDTLAGAAAR